MNVVTEIGNFFAGKHVSNAFKRVEINYSSTVNNVQFNRRAFWLL